MPIIIFEKEITGFSEIAMHFIFEKKIFRMAQMFMIKLRMQNYNILDINDLGKFKKKHQ